MQMEGRIIKRIMLIAIPVMAILVFSNTVCYYDNEQELYQFTTVNCDTTNVTYTKTIAPIMQTNCNFCHDQTSASGGINTSGYSNLVVIANNGKLWGTVNHDAGFSFMPKGGGKLSGCDLAKIAKWIHDGSKNN